MSNSTTRMGVVQYIYHQHPNQQSTGTSSRFSCSLSSKEQVYFRQLEATDMWKPIDHGWLKEVSLIYIENNARYTGFGNPTDDEKEQLSKQVLEVRYNDSKHFFPIIPNQSLAFTSSSVRDLVIRSRSQTAPYTLYLFPR